jgi:hypothetical protein
LHSEQIKDKDIAGRWRSYLGQYLDMDKLQMDCVAHWEPYMKHTLQASAMLRFMKATSNTLHFVAKGKEGKLKE